MKSIRIRKSCLLLTVVLVTLALIFICWFWWTMANKHKGAKPVEEKYPSKSETSTGFSLIALPNASYEFNEKDQQNKIDYFYLEGSFAYQVSEFEKLKKKIDEKAATINGKAYHLYSIYIYKKTAVIHKQYQDGRKGLDGHNKDLIAYVRYTGNKADIFYITKNGNVIYDVIAGKTEDFEFDQ